MSLAGIVQIILGIIILGAILPGRMYLNLDSTLSLVLAVIALVIGVKLIVDGVRELR